jgi:hypothetical protein
MRKTLRYWVVTVTVTVTVVNENGQPLWFSPMQRLLAPRIVLIMPSIRPSYNPPIADKLASTSGMWMEF